MYIVWCIMTTKEMLYFSNMLEEGWWSINFSNMHCPRWLVEFHFMKIHHEGFVISIDVDSD
jgi:hypothetical protein